MAKNIFYLTIFVLFLSYGTIFSKENDSIPQKEKTIEML